MPPQILAGQGFLSKAYQELIANTRQIRKKVRTKISEYCDKVHELEEITNEIKAEGTPESFSTILKTLESDRANMANGNDISQKEIDRFIELEASISTLEEQSEQLKNELKNLTELKSPMVVIPGYFSYNTEKEIIHSFYESFPNTGDNLQKAINEFTENLQPKWNEAVVIAKTSIYTQLQKIIDQLNEECLEYRSLKRKVEQNEQVQKITKQIASERDKLGQAEKKQEQKRKTEQAIAILQQEIIYSQQEYLEAYTKYCEIVISTGTKKQTSLTFSAEPVWKIKEFELILGNIFDNRNYVKFQNIYGFNLSFLKENDYSADLLKKLLIATADSRKENSLTIKAAYTLETALQQLFEDWYNIHYIVKSGNDTIDSMSPGKKALVLLELLISLEDSKCPLLIDQPEDDLDNRSVYDDLVQYIKQKKKERQIIIVTHNANIVLGADAEEVIIANQDGKGTENASRRFEYRSGSIENDQIEVDDNGAPLNGILNQCSIQEQICDILEGGPSAFELRKNKYMAIAQSKSFKK